ncbi:SDR family oxidoreductase [Nocardia sp. NPDC003963]
MAGHRACARRWIPADRTCSSNGRFTGWSRGIRINAVAPGPSVTDFNGGAMRDDPELRSTLAAQTALGRVGEPDEIGDAVAALASGDMRWVTAERIEVSGGSLI